MQTKELVEIDLKDYLVKADNLTGADKLVYLRAIFDKHLIFTKAGHKVTRHDLFGISNTSKTNFSTQRVRVQVSGKQVEHAERLQLATIDSFISYLNRNDLLKKHVAFDYTDDSEQYDVLE